MFLQVPNFIAWDEDSCGVPGHLLHIGVVQWFWDHVVECPRQQQCNVLLVQTDEPETVAHLMAWLHQPPSVVHLLVSHGKQPNIIARCRAAMEDPPPNGVDHDTLLDVASGFQDGIPSWEIMADRRQQLQAETLQRRERRVRMQQHQNKLTLNTRKVKDKEFDSSDGSPTDSETLTVGASPSLASPAESASEDDVQDEAGVRHAMGQARPVLEERMLQQCITPSQPEVTPSQGALTQSCMYNVKHVLERENIPGFSEQQTAVMSADVQVPVAHEVETKTKFMLHQKVLPTCSHSSMNELCIQADNQEGSTSSNAQPHQQPIDGAAPVSGQGIMLEFLGLEE